MQDVHRKPTALQPLELHKLEKSLFLEEIPISFITQVDDLLQPKAGGREKQVLSYGYLITPGIT